MMPMFMLTKAFVTLSVLVFASAGQGMVRNVQRITRKINYFDDSSHDIVSSINSKPATTLNWLPNPASDHSYDSGHPTVVIPAATETSVPTQLDESTPVEASPLKRPIEFEIAKGLQEGLITELITFAFHDQSFSYAGPEGVHHAFKSLLLDMFTNAFTALSPLSNLAGPTTCPTTDPSASIDGGFQPLRHFFPEKPAGTKSNPHHATLAAVRVGLLFVRCVVAPLLVHGMAHVVPTAAVQFVVENAELEKGLALVQ